MFGLISKRRHEREMKEAVDRIAESAYKLGTMLSQVKLRNGSELFWNQVDAIYTTNISNKGELDSTGE